MTRRGAFIKALIDAGFVASNRHNDESYSHYSVTAMHLRRLGYIVHVLRGEGYRMDPEERERLAASPYAKRSMEWGGCASASSIVVMIPTETLRVLGELALEQGRSLCAVAAAAIDRGIDAEMSA